MQAKSKTTIGPTRMAIPQSTSTWSLLFTFTSLDAVPA